MISESAADAAETLAVVLTAPGRGAIAVVAVRGPKAAAAVDAHFDAVNGKAWDAQPPQRVVFGEWRRKDRQDSGEDVVVSRAADGSIEVHCHGGVAAVERILACLASGGCRIVTPEEWLRASFPLRSERGETKPLSKIAMEAELALPHAITFRTAVILADQRRGALERAVRRVVDDLAKGKMLAVRSMLDDLLARRTLGLRLTAPWRVAIAGPPNVGKSSLANAILGYERSIVFDEPGTTRDVLAADAAIDGWPVRLTDSAGIRETECEIEAAGVSLARQQLDEADLVLWVVDAQEFLGRCEAELAAPDFRGTAGRAAQSLVVANKIDLLAAPPSSTRDGLAFVSAATRAGLDELLAAISRRLVPYVPPRGAAVPFLSSQVETIEGANILIARGDASGAARSLAALLGCD